MLTLNDLQEVKPTTASVRMGLTEVPILTDSFFFTKKGRRVMASYYYEDKKVYLRPSFHALLPAFKAGILAHELGHAHEQQWRSLRHWDNWVSVWEELVSQGVLDGYAAKNPREGWAEIYRLKEGYPFDPSQGGTSGKWQYDPQKVMLATFRWKAMQ